MARPSPARPRRRLTHHVGLAKRHRYRTMARISSHSSKEAGGTSGLLGSGLGTHRRIVCGHRLLARPARCRSLVFSGPPNGPESHTDVTASARQNSNHLPVALSHKAPSVRTMGKPASALFQLTPTRGCPIHRALGDGWDAEHSPRLLHAEVLLSLVFSLLCRSPCFCRCHCFVVAFAVALG
jgi:hypothetical protein